MAIRGAPTVGTDADLDLAPLCTFRIDEGANANGTWAAAKVLKSEIMRIHLRIAAERWTERPAAIPPAAWSPAPISVEAASGDRAAVWPVLIGHYPLSRTTFSGADPRFAGVTTLEHEKLDGMPVADGVWQFTSLARSLARATGRPCPRSAQGWCHPRG